MTFLRKAVCVIICIAVLSAVCFGVSASTPMLVETQYTYSVANPAWLKDIIVKENMAVINDLSKSCTLKAVPDYPYKNTPDSFKTEVEYYVSLYTLDQSAQRAAYIYVLEKFNSFASASMTENVSDEFIKNYLEGEGIIYPDGGLNNGETLIFARALYSVMSVNALGVTIPEGTALESALLVYAGNVFGYDIADLIPWSSGGTINTLTKYIIAASKVTLSSNGYNVTAATSDEEVYRLMAIMTIRQTGISVDEKNASYDEIKVKYMAALLGQRYGITINPPLLEVALNSGTVPMYLLQVIGQQAGITVKSTMVYSDAFILVAEQSSYFDLVSGEFYADVFNYEIHLDYLRPYIWISPTPLREAVDGAAVNVYANGSPIPARQYTQINLSTSAEVQTIAIQVAFSDATQSLSRVYNLKIFQGSVAAPASEDTAAIGSGNSMLAILTGNTLTYFSSIFSSPSSILPPSLSGIASLLVPETSNSSGSSLLVSDFLSGALQQVAYSQIAANVYPADRIDTTSPTQPVSIGIPDSLTVDGGTAAGEAVSSPQVNGVPLALAGSAPEGFRFLTNEEGYITGIEPLLSDNSGGDGQHAAEEPGGAIGNLGANGTSTFSWSMLRSRLLIILIPVSLALICLAFAFIFNKSKRNANIIAVNHNEKSDWTQF